MKTNEPYQNPRPQPNPRKVRKKMLKNKHYIMTECRLRRTRSQRCRGICSRGGLPSHFISHSLRSGGSQSKSIAGTPSGEIMQVAHWKTEKIARYYVGSGGLLKVLLFSRLPFHFCKVVGDETAWWSQQLCFGTSSNRTSVKTSRYVEPLRAPFRNPAMLLENILGKNLPEKQAGKNYQKIGWKKTTRKLAGKILPENRLEKNVPSDPTVEDRLGF